MSDDIIVNGYRVARDLSGSGFFAHRGGGGEGSDMSPHPTLSPDGGGGAPPEPTDYDPPRVAAEVTNSANAAAVQAATQQLTNQVSRLTPIINSISNNAVIRFGNGRTMSGQNLKQLWLVTDFTVTDRDFGTDRGGATNGFESIIRFSTVVGYAAFGPGGANGQSGLSFLIFHEMSHIALPGRQFYTDQYALYRARRPGVSEAMLASQFDGDQIEFRRTEQFVNIAAFAMMEELRLIPPSERLPGNLTRENFPVFGVSIEP
jgi:hypothetical protein